MKLLQNSIAIPISILLLLTSCSPDNTKQASVLVDRNAPFGFEDAIGSDHSKFDVYQDREKTIKDSLIVEACKYKDDEPFGPRLQFKTKQLVSAKVATTLVLQHTKSGTSFEWTPKTFTFSGSLHSHSGLGDLLDEIEMMNDDGLMVNLQDVELLEWVDWRDGYREYVIIRDGVYYRRDLTKADESILY